ncbi:bifunctional ornithine acetyltransferase/N-acetylglutamate synthase [Caldanaerobius polysaccharolyticus]|uniref:bifunctional ornithine acetyltransferase/N-acetylglutamate synthase n=1 Tax=Caldanaerobius polysaccharolyticus TaxID=44256 RepID=UPI00047B983E|nr:bifunctional ornithine acetyltransferase/N-acetylglutamate synthase [Caldanaerobius polysaccharolyticus]
MDVIFNEGGVTAPEGFLAAGVHCGIKRYKKDVAVVYSRVPAVAAGVFTTNRVKAAPLKITMENLRDKRAQVIVANSGNANACTGERGMKDAKEMAELTAKELGCRTEDVVVASTGVIGVRMPMEKVRDGIIQCCRNVSKEGGVDAACAIMTTDTFKKEMAVKIDVSGKKVTIGGMAKGSGMIHPNMATMLCFITTDASIEADALEKALRRATVRSFNMISVDGDTSTNDMAVVLANGLAGNRPIQWGTEDFDAFYRGLETVCVELAKMMARDGEGATKFMEVEVKNAPDELSAVKAARSITRSNLVKAAIFGEDANWGRIICAVGYSGIDFNPELVDIYICSKAGELILAQNGMGLDFSEDKAREILKEKDIKVIVDLKQGYGHATAWGCDLSYDYVKINGSYRT